MPNPFIRRSHKGAAPVGNLLANILAGDLTFTLRAGQGANFPDGSIAPFVVKWNRGGTTEEKGLVASRVGDTFTLVAGGRGYDDTLAQAQALGVTVEHTGSAIETDEANLAVVNTIGRAVAIGDILVCDGPNSFKRVAIGAVTGQVLTVTAPGVVGWGASTVPVSATIPASQTTSSVGPVDLTTPGPAVTVTISAAGKAKVTLTAAIDPGSGGEGGLMGFALSGTNVAGSTTAQSLAVRGVNVAAGGGDWGEVAASAVFFVSGLVAGATTFTAKYRTYNGLSAATFANRSIIVETY